MVLNGRSILLVLVVLLVGCGQSLFDARGPGRGGGDGGGDDELGTCNAPCIADAAADFDGTATGRGGRWRYLDDLGNRQWAAMSTDGTEMTGNAGRNRITTCARHGDEPACEALPSALLVTSAGGVGGAGASGGSDPAIEFTASSAQVIQLRVRAFLPSGDAQLIRLYRNSREDVLFTGLATPRQPIDEMVTLDALAGDRFLVAIAASSPTAGGATNLGLHLTISAMSVPFPSSCQLALAFEVQTGSNVVELCRGGLYSLRLLSTSGLAPLMRVPGPFFEQGYAARINDGTHFIEVTQKTLSHADGLTVQFWVQQASVIGIDAVWPFSDVDPDFGTGVGVAIVPFGPSAAQIAATAFSDTTTLYEFVMAPLPAANRWHFVRVVHTATGIAMCVDGVRVASASGQSRLGPTTEPPVLGSEQYSTFAHFDGTIDDVRAITGALPCE